MKKIFISILIVLLTAGLGFAVPSSPSQPAAAGGGDVSTDTIWDAAGDVVIGTGANTGARLAKGAEGTVLTAGAATVSWVAPTVYQASSATLSSLAGLTETAGGIPYGTADNTYAWLAAGATTEILVGGGAAAPVWTTATGSGAPMRGTSPAVTTSIVPASADGATLGSTSAEWSDLYLADGGVIYGQNNQGNTITSSATGWTFNLAVTASSFTAAKSDSVAGDMSLYEANSTDTDAAGFRGPDSMTGDTSYRLKMPSAKPSSANMFMVWATTADSGDGAPASPYAVTGSWLDADSYSPVAGSSSITTVGTVTSGNVDAAVTDASTTAKGKVELAIDSEVNTGTSATLAVTPDSLAGSYAGTKDVGWTIIDSDTVTAVADGKKGYAVPASLNGMNLIDFTCSVADLNSASGGSTDVVLRRMRAGSSADMTSTATTIAYDAYTASDETVDTSNDDLATGDILFVDINAVTTGAAQKGLFCTAIFRLP